MNSAAKSIGEEVENLQAFGSKAHVSYHTLERGIFRYGLAVLSVALAFGIKLLLQQLHFGYPLSTSFLAAIAVTFWYAGTGPGILALLLSCAAFGFFVLPYQVDYRIVLADGSTKPVYASRSGLSHLLYFFYFALVALVMSWFSSSRRRAERLLSQARDRLETKVAERTTRLRKLNDELRGQIAERALAEDHLRQTEQRLRDLIANTPVILFALDRSGVLTLSEGKGLDTFGVKPGELVGQSIFDLYHDSPDLHSNARRALAGESVTFVTEAKNHFFEIHLIPVLDKSEKVVGVTGVTYNITDRRKTERELRLVIDTIPAMSWWTLADGPNEYCSKGWMEYTGMKQGEELGYGWLEAFHPEDREAHFGKWRAATETGGLFESVARIRGADGVYRWFLTQGVPLRDESGKIVRWYGTNVDIDERKRAEALLTGENRILEMVAKGDSLSEILNSLCRLVEEQASNVLASILLVKDGRLRHGGAPDLLKAYTEAIDGTAIGPIAGSCGTAAYTGTQVIVEDIATDPLWVEHRDKALSHSLRACWSTPIFSTEGKVSGTFAMYYREPRRPTERDQQIIGQITHLAGIAIERKLTQDKLSLSERNLTEAQKLTHTGSFVWDITTRKALYLSDEWYRIYGFDPEKDQHAWNERLKRVYPDDLPRWRAAVEQAIDKKSDYELEYRLVLPEGVSRYIHLLGHPVFGASGNVVQFIGSVTDITERKRAEALLAGEKRLLEMIATGVPLKEIAGELCQIIEEQRPDTLASVLLLNADGVHLDVVAGPKLPNEWARQMEKMPIGPCAGSCGTAAY